MRKFEQSDKEFIQKLRAHIRQECELTLDAQQPDYALDDIYYDEFHNSILKNSKIKSIIINGSSLAPKCENGKEHTIYQIEIVTNQLTYTINRRFREFYDLYKKIKKQLPKQCDFPKKNYNPFVSSISQTIIKQRISKLNNFMNEALESVLSHKDSLVTLKLFNFIQLKKTYQDQQLITNQYQFRKSRSQKIKLNRFYNFKGHFSQSHLNHFNEDSLEIHIAFINQPSNPGKYLMKLDEIIKNKKLKATSDEIKVIYTGFDNYYGVLRFGLTNSLQSNRIAALEILIDLLMPERNITYERYEKVLQKLPLQLWIVEDIDYLDNTIFKILYFKLLSIYCNQIQKEHTRQKVNLKILFFCHEDIMNDYYQWKKVHNREHHVCLFDSSIMTESSSIDWSQKIDIGQFKDQMKGIQTILCQLNNVQVYYYEPKNTLILTLTTTKSIIEISQISLNWNRFLQSYTIEEYTGLYRYSMKNNQKKWNVRLKIQSQAVNDDKVVLDSKSTLLPQDAQDRIKDIVSNSTFKMTKQQSPYEFFPQYQEQIWVQKICENTTQLLIILKTSRNVDIFDSSLRPEALNFAEDAVTIF